MKRMALTGGIACGKSEAGGFFAAAGVPVCEADRLAHDLMRRDEPVYQAVVTHFGPDILGADGEIDRTRLGALVFSDDSARAALNGLTHPAVVQAFARWFEGLPSATPVAVAVIPLLFEAGLELGWDRVVTVVSPADAQWARLLARGLTEDGARQRLAAQWPAVEKMRRADVVLFNGGTRAMLKEQVECFLRHMRENE